jgi:hypothetical protein
VPDASHCGCVLEAGCWGSGGWHLARFDQRALYNHEKRRFAAERDGWTVEELRRAWSIWLDTETAAGNLDASGMHITWKPYVGLPYAFEPCPAYRAKVRATLENHQAERQTEKRKTYDGRKS